MKLLSSTTIPELLAIDKGPFLSVYLPTHRTHPDNLQDPILYQNLLKKLEKSLLSQYSSAETTNLLSPFWKLAEDGTLWNHTPDGLAILGTEDYFTVIGLNVTVKELAHVANSFHLKPLRRALQGVDRYHVLGLSLQDMQLFEGNRHGLAKVDMETEAPATIQEALGEELTDKYLNSSSFGGIGGTGGNMYHGQGGKADEIDNDTERYFRAVANFVHDNYSKPTGLPLILAALPEHHNLFHKQGNNPFLLSEGITVNYKSLSPEKFTEMAWEVMEPAYLNKLKEMGNRFEQARHDGKGSDQLREVSRAAAEGRVDHLIIQAERIVAGKIIDHETGAIEEGEISDPETDDLLDDIGELVEKMGGKVVVVPQEKIPSQTGLAAIFRY